MKPDIVYTRLQRELQGVLERNEDVPARRKLEKQLQEKFMEAWHFSPDRLRLSARLASSIKLLPLYKGGLDHCSCLTGQNDQRVIVTQPYGDFEKELKHVLWLNDQVFPEIISATEWGYYYPGHTNLFILRFPASYAGVIAKRKAVRV